jgi:hypothetical protein
MGVPIQAVPPALAPVPKFPFTGGQVGGGGGSSMISVGAGDGGGPPQHASNTDGLNSVSDDTVKLMSVTHEIGRNFLMVLSIL